MPEHLSPRQFQLIARALADARRVEILERIAAKPEAACSDMTECFAITKATLSHHLKELTTAGLIEVRRQGKFAFLKFSRDVFESYLRELRKKMRPR